MSSPIHQGDTFVMHGCPRPWVVIGRVRFPGVDRFLCRRKGTNYSLLLKAKEIQRHQVFTLDSCIIY